MNKEEWLERYTNEFMRAANLSREQAVECATAVSYEEARDGFEDNPEDAALEEMSYWEPDKEKQP